MYWYCFLCDNNNYKYPDQFNVPNNKNKYCKYCNSFNLLFYSRKETEYLTINKYTNINTFLDKLPIVNLEDPHYLIDSFVINKCLDYDDLESANNFNKYDNLIDYISKRLYNKRRSIWNKYRRNISKKKYIMLIYTKFENLLPFDLIYNILDFLYINKS